MLSAICFNLEQSKILSSGNGSIACDDLLMRNDNCKCEDSEMP